MHPTKNSATVSAYLHRAQGLIIRMKTDLDIESTTPSLIAAWAILLRPNVRPATWRQYRAALLCYFKFEQDPEIGQAIELLQTSSCSVCLRGKNAPSRTSSSKKRQISQQELAEIVEYLDVHITRWSFPTAIWLQVSILTGLRPSEWLHSQLEIIANGEPVLVVTNAKNTNGRSNGEVRHLLLSNLPAESMALIRTQMEIVAVVVERNLWDRWCRECRKTLYSATRALWPKRTRYPTLYTGRHQFVANAKRSGLTKIEIAALLGHASEQTAARHYGKKRSGINEVLIKPHADDVARLKFKTLEMPSDWSRNLMS